MLSRNLAAAMAVGAGLSASLIAQSAPDVMEAAFFFNGTERSFEQRPDVDGAQVASHQRPSANCGALCIAPLMADADVQTVGEREVISFVADQVANGSGLLIDSRNAADRTSGFITDSVNVPGKLLLPQNPFLNDIMQAMGARSFEGSLNFADTLPLMIFDDGPSTTDAPNLINSLLALGYPAEKISYYRGGMLVWTALGLNTEDAKS
jgi:hypothetical protein